MTCVSKYCNFVKLSTSSPSVEMIVAAQTYFQKQGLAQVEVSDAAVVRSLWQQMREPKETDTDERYLAEICLRCYISHQIYQVCLDLATKFGNRNGFTCQDLLPFVLDDEVLLATPKGQQSKRVKSTQSSYQSLATTVLKTFDPAKGSLNTWVNRGSVSPSWEKNLVRVDDSNKRSDEPGLLEYAEASTVRLRFASGGQSV